jgi:chromosome partitioning protein
MSQAKKVPVVSVLNMKGGVGKTTITAHLFRHMVDSLRKSILLVDFDPQFNFDADVNVSCELSNIS